MPSRAANISSSSSRTLLPNVITLKRYTCRQQPRPRPRLIFGRFSIWIWLPPGGAHLLTGNSRHCRHCRHLSNFVGPPKCFPINIPTKPTPSDPKKFTLSLFTFRLMVVSQDLQRHAKWARIELSWVERMRHIKFCFRGQDTRLLFVRQNVNSQIGRDLFVALNFGLVEARGTLIAWPE